MSTDHTAATTALAHAESLDRKLRRKGRWLAYFQGAFGVVSLAMALGFAMLPQRTATLVVMPIYGVCIAALSVYAAQQKTSLKGTMKLHGWMMAAWAAAWGATVALASLVLQGQPWVWVAGGLVMLVICLIAATKIWRMSR